MSWYKSYYIDTQIDMEEINKYKDFFIVKEELVDDLEKEYNNSLEKIEFLSSNNDLSGYLSKMNSLSLLKACKG